MKVTVWNLPEPQASVAETQDTVATLRKLGYRASLRLLPDSSYFTYTNDSRNHAQVIDAGWSADYPQPTISSASSPAATSSPATGQQPPTAANSATPPSTNKSPARPPCKRQTP
jgi:hypothetical protein